MTNKRKTRFEVFKDKVKEHFQRLKKHDEVGIQKLLKKYESLPTMEVLEYCINYCQENKGKFIHQGGVEMPGFKKPNTKSPIHPNNHWPAFTNTYEYLVRQHIEFNSQLWLDVFNINLSLKQWVNISYKTHFLEEQLKDYQEILKPEPNKEKNKNSNYEINQVFINGDFPSIFKFKPSQIEDTLIAILIIEKIEDIIKEKDSDSEKGGVEFNGSFSVKENQEGNFTIKLPVNKIKKALQKEVMAELKKAIPKREEKSISKFMSRKEVAEMAGVSTQTVKNWVKQDLIPETKKGNVVRYPTKEILEFLKAKKPLMEW